MACENKHGIIPFNGSGFDNWKFRVCSVLKAMELNDVLQVVSAADRNDTWIKKNNKACMIIIQSVADSHLEYIKEIEVAYDMLEKLEKIFDKKGTCSKFYLLKELTNMKFDSKGDIQDHFARCDRIFRELKNLGSGFEDSDMACFLLLSMSSEFDGIVTAIRTLSENDLTMEFVKGKLLEFSRNKNIKLNGGEGRSNIPSSFAASKQIKCYKCGKLGHVQSVCGVKCFTCNKLGHKSSQCKQKSSNPRQSQFKNEANFQNQRAANYTKNSSGLNYEQSQSEELEKDVAFHVSACVSEESCDERNSIEWYADSGATHHYINDEDVLINKRRFLGPKIVQLAEKGKDMVAICVGDVELISKVGDKHVPIILKNVLCIPSLRINLLSLSTIEKAGFKIVCVNGKIIIEKGEQVYVEGKRCNNLYKIIFQLRTKVLAGIAITKDSEIWHRRYGHLNYDSLFNIKRFELANGFDFKNVVSANNEICEVCVKSKQKCFPYRSKSSRSGRVLELIHTDVCGPLTPMSYNKKRYFVTFVDDYSRFVMVYVIKSKDEVFKCFMDYEAKVTSLFCNMKISKIKCDNGGEYRSKELIDFCSRKGIQILYVPPYTPQLNGVAERMNQTLMNMARSMIMQANMDKVFWEDAILTSAYITNRTPSSLVRNKTPYELWLGRKPNVSNMRVFGCVGYVRIPECMRTKLDNKGVKCVFVGYTENGYRLWNEKENKMIHSRNVVFDENKFFNIKINDVQSCECEIECKCKDECGDEYKNKNNDSELDNDESEKLVEKNTEIDKDNIENINETLETENERPKRERKLPSKFDDYDLDISCLCLLSELSNAPKSYSEAKDSSQWNHWGRAVEDELLALKSNETWVLVNRPDNKEVIGNRWVFRQKKDNEDRSIYKARLVARGFEQTFGEFNQIHAPVAKLSTLRVLLSITNNFGLFLEQLDVKNAFLHSDIQEDIFMKIPEGLTVSKKDKDKVCLLKKAIYGLKQAPKAWNKTFHSFMTELKFNQSKSDYCLYSFFNQNIRCYLLLYVDDILIACNDTKFLSDLKFKLSESFKLKQLSNQFYNFLGINIDRDMQNKIVSIDQTLAIQNLVKKFNVENCKTFKTPIERNLNLKIGCEISESTRLPYKELLGSLMYLMMGTRPDICFSISYFGQFQDCATDEHFKHLLRVLKYLKYTANYKLYFYYSKDNVFGFADADWANNINDRKSISGYCFKLFNNLVCWSSKKQTSVALSSTESEFVAVCVASCELLYLKNLLFDLKVDFSLPITLFEDNQSAIKLLQNFENNKRCKHIDVKLHFVIDLISNGIMKVTYVCTEQQLADIFTKSLCNEKFYTFVKMLNLGN